MARRETVEYNGQVLESVETLDFHTVREEVEEVYLGDYVLDKN